MKKIRFHKKCFTHRLDDKWEWEAPVWFTKAGIFADCVIVNRQAFDTEKQARDNIKEVLAKFGVK